ncbi:MAG: DEDD exonuclease domain-containing protein [Bacteroidota bacterium]
MLLEDATFVVTDTETTGTRAGEDRVIEIGAVKVRGGEVVDTFGHLIDPERHVPRRITRITGLSTASVFGEPTAKDVLPDYLDFLGEGVLVAHNLGFDLRFLQAELDRAGLPAIENESVCTLRLARRLLPSLPSRGLTALQAHFGITNPARHRALGDAEATAEVLLRFLDRLRAGFGLTTVADLVAFQRKRYKDASGEPKHVQHIRDTYLGDLPDRPGVYFMKRKNGEVLYVGKAKSLRNRVRSYFTSIDAHPTRTRKLVRDVRAVEWTETGSELGALLLESKLIKTLLPRYNRAQRRYKNYPFLRLDAAHGFPTLSWTSSVRADGAEYYGPLGRKQAAAELVELVGRVFRLRECDPVTWQAARASENPCLYGSMDRCLAPCEGDKDDAYGAEVERIRRFLTGQDTEVLETVEAAMREAAGRLEFEQAGWYRDQLERLRRTLDRQRPFATAVHDRHAVLVEPGLKEGEVQLFLLRFGRLVQTRPLPVPPTGADVADLRETLGAHFDPALAAPEVFHRSDVDEINILARWMRLNEGSAQHVRWTPERSTDDLLDGVLAAARSA